MTDRDDPHIPEEQLHGLIRGGTRATLAAQAASQLASLAILAILYRLLRPEDYGLLGMALPAVMLPRMAATLGVGAAIVQAPQLNSGQRTSLFWLMQCLGLSAAIISVGLGALLASAYGQPLLLPLTAALAGSTLLAALGQTHQSLLERRLVFGPLATARVAAQLAGGLTAIAAAGSGWGVWSLVVQQVAEMTLLTGLSWRLESWRPSRPSHGERLGGLVAFSGYFAATNLVFYVAQNLEKVLFPWLLGPSAELAIGLFSQAMNFVMRIVFLFTSSLSGVMLPALSRAQHNRVLFAEIVARFFRMTAIGLFPCGVGLFLVAPEVMLLLGGPKWRDAGDVLRSLAPLLLVQGFLNLTGSIFGAQRQGRRLLAGSLVYLVVLAQGIAAGWLAAEHLLSRDSASPIQRTTLWMAAAYTLVSIVVIFVPYTSYCLRSAGVTLRSALAPLLPALRGALLMGVVVWGLGGIQDALAPALDFRVKLAGLVVAGAGAYVLVARKEVLWLWNELRR